MPSGYHNLVVTGIDDTGEILALASTTQMNNENCVLLYSGGQWSDLASLFPPNTPCNPADQIFVPTINDGGQILIGGFRESQGLAYLLTPQQANTPPTLPTTISLSVSSTNVPAGQAVALKATVANKGSNTNTPMGSVSFFDGSMVLGTVILIDDTASLTMTLPAGGYNITAQYNGFTQGNVVYNPSTSTVQAVTISSPGDNGGSSIGDAASTPPTEVGNPPLRPVASNGGGKGAGTPAPVGGLSLVGFGFAPGWQPDVFEVDQAGQVFAVPLLSFFEGMAHPTFVNNDVALSNTQLFEDSLVSFLHGSNGQPYLMDVLTANTTYLTEAMADAALNHL
jgi:hypothetical protein